MIAEGKRTVTPACLPGIDISHIIHKLATHIEGEQEM
jgi:hypothetical protein